MKILVLADAHGGRWKSKNLIEMASPDVIVIPGDLPSSIDFPVLFMTYGRGGNRTMYVKEAYERYNERLTYRQIRTAKRLMLSLLPFNIPVLLIHGNTETRETREWLRLFCYRYPNFHWIADRSFTLQDTQFIGHGWVSYDVYYNRIPSPGEIHESNAKSLLLNTIGNSRRNMKSNILISHAPPFGTSLDFLPHKQIHTGSLPVREIMDSRMFQGVICGHLHESRGIHKGNKWWGVNAGSVIEDHACLIDSDSLQVIWYRNVVNNIGLSPFIYRNRASFSYDQTM